MHASKVKVGGRYNLKIFGNIRPVDVVGFQSYNGKERPKKIWSVVEVNTGKCYSVFSARSFVEKLNEGPKPPDPYSENPIGQALNPQFDAPPQEVETPQEPANPSKAEDVQEEVVLPMPEPVQQASDEQPAEPEQQQEPEQNYDWADTPLM